ncbi:hypothetical protein [Bradyrhizobium sp.]|uniref:hypothetical protein n=1 Tax=Bradyrhizobium sp. TaxID=376 RepID=UPI003C45FBCE
MLRSAVDGFLAKVRAASSMILRDKRGVHCAEIAFNQEPGRRLQPNRPWEA